MAEPAQRVEWWDLEGVRYYHANGRGVSIGHSLLLDESPGAKLLVRETWLQHLGFELDEQVTLIERPDIAANLA